LVGKSGAVLGGGAIVFPEVLKQTMDLVQVSGHHDSVVDQIYPSFGQQADSYAVVQYHLDKLKALDPQADFLKSMIYLELKQRLPELLLMRVDKMTMATSVEGRVPFLDHKLIEFAFHIPMRFKYNGKVTKYILKKACEGILPYDVIYRKKMGFAAPTSRWFKKGTYFKTYLQDMLHSKNNDWDQYLNVQAIRNLLDQNQKDGIEFSHLLWAVQNVMGCSTR